MLDAVTLGNKSRFSDIDQADTRKDTLIPFLTPRTIPWAKLYVMQLENGYIGDGCSFECTCVNVLFH